MMRFLLSASGFLLLAAGTVQAAEPQPIHYEFSPQLGADGLEAIAVTVRFAGDDDGETRLALPDSWAGSDRLYEAISGLAVDGGRLQPGADSASRSVLHAPGAALTVRYLVTSAAQSDPGPDYEKAWPVIRPGWFYIHGEGAIVMPAGRNQAPARFSWGAAPAGWTLASDLDGATELSANEVGGAIFAGGTDWRLVDGEAGGAPVRLGLRGEWDFSDAALLDALTRIVSVQNGYLDSDATPYFVSLIPLTGAETGALSSGGSGRSRGFALAATRNVGFDDLLRTLAHEYGHRWFGGAFGPIGDKPAAGYWFTEGFGDFLAGRSLLQAGLWDVDDYLGMLNRLLLRYASSPARGLDNAALAEVFWSDPAAQQMPYDRGHLFALLLDGPGGALREPLARMAMRPGSFPADESQSQRFVRAAGVEPGRLAAMLAGEPIVLPEDLFAPCGRLEWFEQPVYATGYGAAEDERGLYFANVEQGSPAWEAGLRPGMRYIRRISFEPGDATVPIVMRIGDSGGERVISWLPAGEDQVRYQRLVPAPGAGEDEGCRARLGG